MAILFIIYMESPTCTGLFYLNYQTNNTNKQNLLMSAPLIGRQSQALIVYDESYYFVRLCVGHAPFRSRIHLSIRCTHQSDRMESLAFGRALKRSRHLRLHPDLVHTRDVPINMLVATIYVILHSRLSRTIMEIGAINPHLMKNDSEFTGHRNDGSAMPFCFHES